MTGSRNVWAKAVFVAGLLVFLAQILWVTQGARLNRALPVEVDDSINYILRGVQVHECPLQDCRALAELRPDLAPVAGKPDLTLTRLEEYSRLYRFYTPLHGVLLASLHATGLSWIAAYDVLLAGGAVLIVFGAAWFLLGLYGPVAAGLGCALVAATPFVGHGLTLVVPSNMALALALLAWGLAIRKGAQAGAWIAALALLMVGVHVTGRGYAAVTFAAYLGCYGRPRVKGDWLALGGSAAAVVLVTLLPALVSRPDFSVPFTATGVDNALWDMVRFNLSGVPDAVEPALRIAGGWTLSLACAVLGLALVPAQRRRKVAVFAVLMAGLCAVSLFHRWPRIPGELFARVWVPCAILLLGAIATLLTQTIVLAAQAAARLWVRPGAFAALGFLAIALPSGVLSLMAGLHLRWGVQAMDRLRVRMVSRHDYSFDASQPARIREADQSCGRIVYYREEVMHGYFLNGALSCGSIFAPIKDGDLGLDRTVTHAASFHPMRFFRNWQPLAAAPPMVVTTPGGKTLFLRLRNMGPAARLALTDASGATLSTLAVPANWSGWLETDRLPNQVSLIPSPGAKIALGGLRGDAPGPVSWPWDQGIGLSFLLDVPFQKKEPVSVDFATATLFPGAGPVRVVADDGLSVLAERLASQRFAEKR